MTAIKNQVTVLNHGLRLDRLSSDLIISPVFPHIQPFCNSLVLQSTDDS